NLVAGSDSWFEGRQFSFDNMKVRSANAACTYAQKNLTFAGRRLRHFANFKRPLPEVFWRNQCRSFHGSSSSTSAFQVTPCLRAQGRQAALFLDALLFRIVIQVTGKT